MTRAINSAIRDCPLFPYFHISISKKEDSQLTVREGETSPRRGIRGSVVVASIVLFIDVGQTGFFGLSFLVCPVWFLVAIVRNAIKRPGWRPALLRIAIPPLVLGIAVANDAI